MGLSNFLYADYWKNVMTATRQQLRRKQWKVSVQLLEYCISSTATPAAAAAAAAVCDVLKHKSQRSTVVCLRSAPE
jgi:protein-disulfide isomerase